MSAQPLALPGCCVFPWSSSQSDLMRFDVISSRFLHLVCFRCNLIITILMCTLSKKRSSLTATTQFVSRRCMERTSFSRLFRCWLRDLGFLLLSFLRTKTREDRLGDTTFLLSTSNFEPELTLRQLRGRLGLIHPHWPAYPNEVGIILGDFNICDPEEGRLMSGTSHSLMATQERLLCSILSFHTSLRLPYLITREETPQPLVSYALFQGLIVFLSFYPWLSTRFSLLLSCLREPVDSDHSE